MRRAWLRFLLGHEVATVQGLTSHVLRHGAPVGQAIEHCADHAAASPERQHRHGDLASGVVAIVLEVDGGRSAVVLATGMDGASVEAAPVLGECAGIEATAPTGGGRQAIEHAVEADRRDHLLGQWRGLDEQEPVVVGARKAMSVRSYMASVGQMSMTVSDSTRSPWSRARRCATRAPRS